MIHIRAMAIGLLLIGLMIGGAWTMAHAPSWVGFGVLGIVMAFAGYCFGRAWMSRP